MKKTQGQIVRELVENLINLVRAEGNPVTVNNQGTVERLFETFALSYTERINSNDIYANLEKYCQDYGIDLGKLRQDEYEEYNMIIEELYTKFKLFERDIHSRQVLWSDDCCISMIQYLVRNEVIHCFVHFRSSDVKGKLFSDLHIIHMITSTLQKKLNINNAIITVVANSLHEIVINDMKGLLDNANE